MTTFKKVAHLYLGCKVKSEIPNINPDGVYNLDGFYSKDTVVISDEMHNEELNVDEIKPILKDLADIAEEDAGEMGYLDADDFNYETDGQYTVMEFKYLLSKHYDLFDLIKNGEAINAKTINQ